MQEFIKYLLELGAIKLRLNSQGFFQAIRETCEPLLKIRAISQEFIDHTISAILEKENIVTYANGVLVVNGPYTSSSTLKSSFAIGTFLKPVKFDKYQIKEFNMLVIVANRNDDYQFETIIQPFLDAIYDSTFAKKLLKQSNIMDLVKVLELAPLKNQRATKKAAN